MNLFSSISSLSYCCLVLSANVYGKNDESHGSQIPAAILDIITKPRYSQATWGLRVVDLDSGQSLCDLRSNLLFYTGSVRKLFSVGLTLNELGADHRFRTPVHRRGELDEHGVLTGDLIVVAS